jgi:hypothetical protein
MNKSVENETRKADTVQMIVRMDLAAAGICAPGKVYNKI